MNNSDCEMYIGTYIDDDENSVYKANLDIINRKISIGTRIAAGKNPSFLLCNEAGTYLYAVNELSMRNHGTSSLIVCLKKNGQGEFVKHNELRTEGNYACHISLSRDERYLFAANYGDGRDGHKAGTISVYTLGKSGVLENLVQTLDFTGSGLNPERQESPHIHATISSQDGKRLFATDLGCDCIYQFDIASGDGEPLSLVNTVEVPAGNGPRHFAWDEDAGHLYVSCELSSSVCSYSCKYAGLHFLQDVKAFPEEVTPYPRTSASEILYYDGHIYMGNRGDDSISVFKVEEAGTLHFIRNVAVPGKTPRNFRIFSTEAEGRAVLVAGHQDSHSIALFSVKNDDLILEGVQKSVRRPVCFHPGG